jgi:hypothetical protein
LLVLLINEVDEVYVGKADKKVNGVAFVFSYHSLGYAFFLISNPTSIITFFEKTHSF